MARNVTFFSLAYFMATGLILWILTFLPQCPVCSAYDSVARILLTFIIAYYTLPSVKSFVFNQRVSPRNKAVLITGCDSGFGHDLAKKLDSIGFRVFASCLFPEGDGARMLKESCSNSLHVFGLDVTKDDSVKDALAYVKENLNQCELWSVVNNAGVVKGFEIAWSRVKDLQEVMEVNTIGVVRVTKAFLPLLRSSKGRVVTVTSMAARVTTPSLSFYCMSKVAASCFCDGLRQELYPWGVKVITIEPEGFRTPIFDWNLLESRLDETFLYLDEESKEDYGLHYFEDYKKSSKGIRKFSTSQIYKAIDSLEMAVTLEEPRNVYTPCRNIFYSFVLAIGKLLPTPITDATNRIGLILLGFPHPKEAEFRF